MSRQSFFQGAAGLALAAAFSLTPAPVLAGGGCGCEGPSSTVYHVHQRCHHGCRHCPPVGMVVPSMPMMGTPMMGMPMMAAPATFATPVTFAAAPTVTLGVTNAQPQFGSNQSQCSGSLTAEQVSRAVAQALSNAQSDGSFGAGGFRTTEQRLSDLETKVSAIERNTARITDLLEKMEKKANE
jgi:hypothetical protein